MADTPQKIMDLKKKGESLILDSKPYIAVGMGTCGIGNGADVLFDTFEKKIKEKKLNIGLKKTGCMGLCAEEPFVNIYIPGKPVLILNNVQKKAVGKIVDALEKSNVPEKMVLCKISGWDHITGKIEYGQGYKNIPEWNEISFFKNQTKIVLRDAGILNPESIEEYMAVGGYSAYMEAITSKNSR